MSFFNLFVFISFFLSSLVREKQDQHTLISMTGEQLAEHNPNFDDGLSKPDIVFEVKRERIKEDPEDDGLSPYIGLTEEGLLDSLNHLQDKETVVIPDAKTDVLIDYPLGKPVTVTIMADTKEGFTRAGLAIAIAKEYQRIYEEEAEATMLPVETMM